MREVAIVGVGLSKFGERWDCGIKELAAEAGLRALEDAGMASKDIEALYGGIMAPGKFTEQEHIAALLADHMGLHNIPATRVENACASGGTALRLGYMAVASGMHDIVVVGGVEKMTDLPTAEATAALSEAGDAESELAQGITFPSQYALMARRHMHDHGTKMEQLAAVAVKNHDNAYKNPFAHFHRRVSIDDVLNSRLVADPLRLLDCSPISDGAAAVILAPLETAKKHNDTPIRILASAQASDALRLADRSSITSIKASSIAAERAYKQARLQPKDIDIAEVHDCFTIAEIMALEDLGFYRKGEAAKAIERGDTLIDSKLPINTSGGLKGCGHPIGATGVKQAVEIVAQLRGEAKDRQAKKAEIGLTHNVGGSGATAVVHIMTRVN